MDNKVLLTIDAETKKYQSVVENKIMTLSKAKAIKHFIDNCPENFEIYIQDYDSTIPYNRIDANIIEDPNIIGAYELVEANIPMTMYNLLDDIEQAMKDTEQFI